MRRGAPARDGSGGFAMVEVMLALMLIAVLAALALPGLGRATGPAALRVAALQISAVLREDRNMSQSARRAVLTVVDANHGRIVSGSSRFAVTMPMGATVGILDAEPSGIRFFADGRSTGGAILIAAADARYLVSVDRSTGAIHVGEP